MKTQMNSIVTLILTIAIFTATSCSQNPIDKALDNYEAIVVKLEKKASQGDSISMVEIIQMEKEMMNGMDIKTLMNSSQPSQAQINRAMEVGTRLQKVMLGNNPFGAWK